MDVEGLLNLEDYVPPQAEKQIANPKKLPQCEMGPSFWQLKEDPPPSYDEIENEQLSLEAPPENEDEDEEFEGEEDMREANKILDQLELPNYDDVEKRSAEPEVTATRQRNYLSKVVNDADKRRRQLVAMKSNARNDFNKGRITEAERKSIHENSDRLRKDVKDYIKNYEFKMKSIKGSGLQKGRGVFFYHNAKEL